MPQYTTTPGQSLDFASETRPASHTLGTITAATIASAVQVAAEAATPTPTALTALTML